MNDVYVLPQRASMCENRELSRAIETGGANIFYPLKGGRKNRRMGSFSGETDWKVIAINMSDPNISEYSNIQDVERMKPGLLKRTVEWFKYYKVMKTSR